MKNQQFFNHQIQRIVKVSISTNAFRNQGRSGLIKATRSHIYNSISLIAFAKSLKNGTYKKFLDQSTNKLFKAMAKYDCKWGTARKGLNIYFRDILNNTYFYKELKLNFKYGAQLEIPLDGITMKKILINFKDLELHKKIKTPKKTSFIKLDKINTERFQTAATAIAKINYRGYTRVDLDMVF